MSIDLDEVHHYFAIHALTASAGGAHAVYDAALQRIASFASAHDIPVTLFAVGEDLDRPASGDALRALSAAGHAVENHSFHHRYDLTQLPRTQIDEEIARGAEAIARVTGRTPTGFRAPGYTIDDAVFDALEEQGVAWDSSVFPCPTYYGAKAAVLAVQRARNLRSAAILGSPRVLLAPARPYRPGYPWWKRGDRSVVELPIQVTPWARLPVIGTSVGGVGETGARLLALACRGEPLVQLELHGMDFLDASDGLEALRAHQPELHTPVEARMAALSAFVETLTRAGKRFVRLDEAAEALERSV
ncbi:polysaccharide deacetylase family protein [Chondromyces crocatus]|uniref:polysaccharide deacetylase family protein n=1 Tax=Chondromyces crocatus TaxID=52 RepID=UPI001FE0B3A6|nr:polysaccharide deacetylase family protein [Chondromyces crocatus]